MYNYAILGLHLNFFFKNIKHVQDKLLDILVSGDFVSNIWHIK